MKFHKEGKGHLLISLVLLFCVLLANVLRFHPLVELVLIVITFVFIVFSMIFFRNPWRAIRDKNDRLLYAPADGKVVVIEEVYEPDYIGGNAIQISIFMSPLNVHVNRMPTDGIIEYVNYQAGKYLVAWHPKSSTENERNSIGFRANNGQKVLLRQIAGALARRIVNYAQIEDRFVQGQEFGFIKLGSRVDVFVPTDANILVDLNQKVVGNVSKISELA